MDLRISDEQRLLQERARRFTDDHLIVHESACEAAGGLDEGGPGSRPEGHC